MSRKASRPAQATLSGFAPPAPAALPRPERPPSADPPLPPPHRILEVAIRDYALDFPDERDPAVESAQFPDMVSIYRSMVTGPFPPTQSDFADEVARRVLTN